MNYSNYCFGLSSDEVNAVDLQVKANRKIVHAFLKDFPLNGTKKTKRVVVIFTIVSSLGLGVPKSCEAIGLSIPTPSITRITKLIRQESIYNYASEIEATKIFAKVNNRVTNRPPKEIIFLMYLTDPKISSNQQLLSVVQQLRGGSWGVVFGVLGTIMLILKVSEGFVVTPPINHPVDGRANPFQPNQFVERQPPGNPLFRPTKTIGSTGSQFRHPSLLQIERPTAMPHQQFGSLTKKERRQLPHANDLTVDHQGYPRLRIGFYQSKWKVGRHGAIHGLPYLVKESGGTKTEKTEDNTIKMMQSVADMPNRDNVRWFLNGTYQGGTTRGFDAIHIYDVDEQIIAVFDKSTGNLVTTCQLTRSEHAELIETGNFGNADGWYNGPAKNLPPQQTKVNNFETDVLGITPVSPMDDSLSPNSGFTPISSFESDITGTTPLNQSQFDNP